MRRDKKKFSLYNRIFVSTSRDTMQMTLSKSKKSKINRSKNASSELPEIQISPIWDEPKKLSNIFPQIKLPKIHFSLGTASASQFRIIENFKPKLELNEENTKKKLKSIYESISQLEKSISSPKMYLDESLYIIPEIDQKSAQFFRDIRSNQETKVLNKLKLNPTLINIRDSVGKTPLHWAVIRNNLPIAQLLLSFGADANAQDYSKRSPKEFALSQDFQCMLNLLNINK